MILSQPPPEQMEKLNATSGEEFRRHMTEFLQTEQFKLWRECARMNQGEDLSRKQGAAMALEELVTVLQAAAPRVRHPADPFTQAQ